MPVVARQGLKFYGKLISAPNFLAILYTTLFCEHGLVLGYQFSIILFLLFPQVAIKFKKIFGDVALTIFSGKEFQFSMTNTIITNTTKYYKCSL